MTLVYIALGSNLASPLEQVQAAIRALGEIPHSRVVAVSSFYRTPPLGPQDQPDYLNAAVALETTLAPREWLLDRFTVADILLAECLRYAAGDAALMADHPVTTGYLARCHARPAFQTMWQARLAEPA